MLYEVKINCNSTYSQQADLTEKVVQILTSSDKIDSCVLFSALLNVDAQIYAENSTKIHQVFIKSVIMTRTKVSTSIMASFF